MPVGQHLMLVGSPIGEAGKVVVSLLAVGVEDVGAVGVHQNPGVVNAIVHVAAHVRSFLDYMYPHPSALCKFAGHYAASKAASHNNGINSGEVYICVGNEVHGHSASSHLKSLAIAGMPPCGAVLSAAILPKIFAARGGSSIKPNKRAAIVPSEPQQPF